MYIRQSPNIEFQAITATRKKTRAHFYVLCTVKKVICPFFSFVNEDNVKKCSPTFVHVFENESAKSFNWIPFEHRKDAMRARFQQLILKHEQIPNRVHTQKNGVKIVRCGYKKIAHKKPLCFFVCAFFCFFSTVFFLLLCTVLKPHLSV